MGDKAVFLASFPPIQSAIKIGQDGMRIQLDVPESEMGNAIDILAWRDAVLRVTIEMQQQRGVSEQPSTLARRTAKKRVCQSGTGV